MKVLIALLVGVFLVAARPSGFVAIRRPIVLAALCIVVGAGFYSTRIVL